MSAYRALWQWPLRSPASLATTAVVVAALLIGVGLAAGALSGERSGPGLLSGAGDADTASSGDAGTSARHPFRGGAAPEPTALPPVPELAPPTLPLSQAPPAALDAARRWAAAWVRPPAGTTTERWVDGLRELTTPEYLAVLGAVDPANVPASSVTGAPRPVRVAASSVQAEVPTDALTLLVLVVETEQGWRVAGHDRA